jgi:hypothetical protein
MNPIARRAARAALTTFFAASIALGGSAFAGDDDDDDFVLRNQTVAQRLGGADGIAAFINARVVPALVNSDIGPFFTGGFTRLTESTGQTVACLARLLDHDLGGSSPKNGAIVVDASAPPAFPAEHKCRSSMSNVHRGMRVNDAQFDLFVSIVAREALNAGVAAADVEAVGKVLSRYRGSITNK